MLTHFSITQQGQRHVERKSPCQDYSDSRRIRIDRLDCELVLVAVSDGVGACEFSQIGSEIAVTSFVSYLQKGLMDRKFLLKDENICELLRSAFGHALEQVEVVSEKKELPFLEFDSTLTGAVYDGNNLWFGHIGDDGIVVLYTDGTYEMITKRHKGEEAHSVFPLRNTELWQFGKTSKDVASFAVMTDGVLDYCVDYPVMNNRIYFPFLEPALTELMDSDKKADCQKKEWDAFFKGSHEYTDKFRDKVTDDISFVIVQNSASVASLPPVKFDFAQWERDTKRRNKEIEDFLYAEYRAYKARLSKECINTSCVGEKSVKELKEKPDKKCKNNIYVVNSDAKKIKDPLSCKERASLKVVMPAKEEVNNARTKNLFLDEVCKLGFSCGKNISQKLKSTKPEIPVTKREDSSIKNSDSHTESKNKQSNKDNKKSKQ